MDRFLSDYQAKGGHAPGNKFQINPTYPTHSTPIDAPQGLVVVVLATGSSSETCFSLQKGE
jgi:hypothetical protein